MNDTEYKEAIRAIPGEPFTAEWCKEADKASAELREAHTVAKTARTDAEEAERTERQDRAEANKTAKAERSLTNGRICEQCGEHFEPPIQRGRPPKKCPTCRG